MSEDKKLKSDEAVLALAAAVTDRACELLTDGWSKGAMHRDSGGAQVSFCIHGALNLALDEVFGEGRRLNVRQDVEDVSVAFICDEAFGKMHSHSGGIPGAAYNDAGQRKHDEVVGVMTRAKTRLWDLTVERDTWQSDDAWVPSKWADVDTNSEQAQQFMHESLN